MLKPGKKAPDFTLQNESGENIKLSSLRGNKVILYFYPKDHTPGCTQESCDFRDSYVDFRKQKIHVFGISKDNVKSHLSFIEKQSLPFSLLSDDQGKVCEAYGVWQEKSMYGKKYMGISRTTYVINESGEVQLTYPKVKIKDHVQHILQDISKKELQ